MLIGITSHRRQCANEKQGQGKTGRERATCKRTRPRMNEVHGKILINVSSRRTQPDGPRTERVRQTTVRGGPRGRAASSEGATGATDRTATGGSGTGGTASTRAGGSAMWKGTWQNRPQ